MWLFVYMGAQLCRYFQRPENSKCPPRSFSNSSHWAWLASCQECLLPHQEAGQAYMATPRFIYVLGTQHFLQAGSSCPLPSWAMSPTQVWSSWNIKCKLCSNRLSAHRLTVVEYYAFCIRCSLRYVCLFVHSHMELEFLLLRMNMKIIFALNPQIQSWKKIPINQALVRFLMVIQSIFLINVLFW